MRYCSSVFVQACNVNLPPHCTFMKAKPRPCPELPVRPTLAAASAEMLSALPSGLFKRSRVLQRCLHARCLAWSRWGRGRSSSALPGLGKVGLRSGFQGF